MATPERGGEQRALLSELRTHLTAEFGCRAAILYGSRARGDWDAASDIDVAAFRDGGEAEHIAHSWQGLHLDLFLYPAGTEPDSVWLRIHGGRVLFQHGDEADRALAAVDAMVAAGPDALTLTEARTRRLWHEKMLSRAQKGDPEGDHRRHWLLMTLLEDYFVLRGQWYWGPKRGLSLMQRETPHDFEVLTAAFKPAASMKDIEAAVAMVNAA